MISVQEEILEHYRYLKSDTKALITEAQGILKMIEKMEKRMVGDGDDLTSR